MSKKGDPKGHHFVPEMIVKRFVNEEDRIFFFDKNNENEGIKRTTPNNLFKIGHLYSAINSDGTKDISLEKIFQL